MSAQDMTDQDRIERSWKRRFGDLVFEVDETAFISQVFGDSEIEIDREEAAQLIVFLAAFLAGEKPSLKESEALKRLARLAKLHHAKQGKQVEALTLETLEHEELEG